MEAKELRIGNWVIWNGPSHQERALISCLTKEEVFFSCGESALISEIEGEPITEEWLVRLGFEKMNNGKYYTKIFGIGTWLMFETKGFTYWVGVGDWNDTDHQSVGLGKTQYIHQLQTLYFALTGQELELK